MSPLHYDPPNEGYTQAIPPGTQAIREGVAAHFGISRHEVVRDLSRCQHQSSEHCVCRAVDWYTRDIAKGTQMRKFLIFAGERLGIQAAIFNNIVWGYGIWRERSPASSPHVDHVHGGFNKWGARNVTREMVDAALAEWTGQEDDMAQVPQAEWDAMKASVEQMSAAVKTMAKRVEKLEVRTRLNHDARTIGTDVAYLREQHTPVPPEPPEDD